MDNRLLGPKDVALIMHLAEYRILTAFQLASLEQRNVRALRRRLRALAAAGIVTQTVKPLDGTAGRPDYVFSLTREGAERAFEQSCQVLRVDPADAVAVSGRLLRHQMLINDFRTLLVMMEHAIPEISVVYLSPDSPFQPRWAPERSFLTQRFKEKVSGHDRASP
jgi:predicted ArsR family transcriptional regulator